MKKTVVAFCILILSAFFVKAQVVVKVKPSPLETDAIKPSAPGPNTTWIDGHWHWSKKRRQYVWVPGYWKKIKKGHLWIPGHWRDVPGGVVWVPGHWAIMKKY